MIDVEFLHSLPKVIARIASHGYKDSNDIGVHDVVEFKQDVQVLSSRMIVLSRVDSGDKLKHVLSLVHLTA